jgi:hypothetical protein
MTVGDYGWHGFRHFHTLNFERCIFLDNLNYRNGFGNWPLFWAGEWTVVGIVTVTTFSYCIFKRNHVPMFGGYNANNDQFVVENCWCDVELSKTYSCTVSYKSTILNGNARVPFPMSICSIQRTNNHKSTGCSQLVVCPTSQFT